VKTEDSLRNGGMVAAVAHHRWGRLRTVSWTSLVLWSATLIAGVILQNAT
jgi:hypothetical protein